MDYETLLILKQNTELSEMVRTLAGQLEFSNDAWDRQARANYILRRRLHWYELLSRKRKEMKKCKNQKA